MRPPIIIAEAGNNHEGKLETAIELLRAAKLAGADIVKFQAGTAEGFARSPSDIERYRNYELGESGYSKLVDEASRVGIPIMFSVWGTAGFLDRFRNLAWFKIAARQANPLYVGAYDRPTCFISIPHDFEHPEILGIRYGIPLHTVSRYPADNPRLDRLMELQERFGGIRPVGYSDHTIGLNACVAAVEHCQAFALEKHFTLDHNFGPLRDHILSATPDEMAKLVQWLKPNRSSMSVPIA